MKLCVCLGALASLVSGCMSQEQRAALLNGPYPLQVDYSRSIEDSIGAGNYDWVSRLVSSVSFPSGETGGGKVTAVLIPLYPRASLDYVLHGQAEAGLRPANLRELLAFGEAYPEVQRKLPILALGTSADIIVTTFHRAWPGGPTMNMFMEIEPKIERVYPFLGDGLLGRMLNVDWLEDPQGYAMYYACFVRPQ
jgi:hypothetical protein